MRMGREAQTEFGGMKKRGSEGGSEGALLDERANKYEKPFNGLRTGPNTFLPNCTRSPSTNPIPYMPEIHTVRAHVTTLKIITSTLFDKLLH